MKDNKKAYAPAVNLTPIIIGEIRDAEIPTYRIKVPRSISGFSCVTEQHSTIPYGIQCKGTIISVVLDKSDFTPGRYDSLLILKRNEHEIDSIFRIYDFKVNEIVNAISIDDLTMDELVKYCGNGGAWHPVNEYTDLFSTVKPDIQIDDSLVFLNDKILKIIAGTHFKELQDSGTLIVTDWDCKLKGIIHI